MKKSVQFKFNNISLVQELLEENKFGWLIAAQQINAVLTELPVVHMT